MNWSDLSAPLIAVFTALFAGSGLKIIERYLQKSKEKDDIATALRDELRTELSNLRKEMSEVEKELDEWKAKYYDVIEKYISAKAQFEAAVKILKEKGLEIPQAPSFTKSDQ